MNENYPTYHHALPAKTVLQNRYLIEDILGQGGFGITYSGYRQSDGLRVAIKEYFPHHIALRSMQSDVFVIHPFPEKYKTDFEKGRSRFLNEARILKELKHLENIVTIYDSFEENGTAYIVMEYLEGLTLGKYVQENGPLPFPELLYLMCPVMKALAEIHKQGLIHRDISPDNIILGLDNQLHLIDFGAASRETTDGSQNTVILKAGYAPPEQYIYNGKMGAWIDVYALCATMFFALTGKPPSEALHRVDHNSLEALSPLDDILPHQKVAIEKGLQLRSADRFHNMEELYEALTAIPHNKDSDTRWGSPLSGREIRKIKRLQWPQKIIRTVSAVAICLLLFGSGFFVMQYFGTNNTLSQSSTNPKAPTASPSPLFTDTEVKKPSSAKNTPSPNADTKSVLSMQDVSHLSLKKAKRALKNLDSTIKIRTTTTYHKTVPAGYVIEQSIAPNTSFSKGQISSILLTVSNGKKTVTPKASASPKPTATPKQAKSKKSTTTPKPTKRKKDYDVNADDDGYATIPLE